MSDDTASNKAVFLLCEWTAGALIFGAVEWLIAGKPIGAAIVFVILAIIFAVTGVTWPALKLRLGPRLSRFASNVEQIASDYRYRTGGIIFLTVALMSTFSFYVHSLRNDLDAYVMPRTITQKQADDLREYLSHHEAHTVTVKVNSLDREATEYAGQLFNALKRTDWDVTMNTSNGDPNTLNDGVCIAVVGQNAGPPDPKHDPQPLLQEAMQSAHIEVTCGSGMGAGDYKLFLLVGHRPLKLGDQEPMLSKIGRWIERLSQ